jgi:hypothetical protein
MTPLANQGSVQGVNTLHDQGLPNTLDGIGAPVVVVHHWPAAALLLLALVFIAISAIVFALVRRA